MKSFSFVERTGPFVVVASLRRVAMRRPIRMGDSDGDGDDDDDDNDGDDDDDNKDDDGDSDGGGSNLDVTKYLVPHFFSLPVFESQRSANFFVRLQRQ